MEASLVNLQFVIVKLMKTVAAHPHPQARARVRVRVTATVIASQNLHRHLHLHLPVLKKNRAAANQNLEANHHLKASLPIANPLQTKRMKSQRPRLNLIPLVAVMILKLKMKRLWPRLNLRALILPALPRPPAQSLVRSPARTIHPARAKKRNPPRHLALVLVLALALALNQIAAVTTPAASVNLKAQALPPHLKHLPSENSKPQSHLQITADQTK